MVSKVLQPIDITSSMFTACSVAEPDLTTGEALWNAATNYAIGNEVVRTTTHKVYVSLATGVDAGLPEATPLRWREVRPSNKWAAFDFYKNTAITSTSTLTLTLKPGIITDLAFFGLAGDSLRIVVKDAVSLVTAYDTTFPLSDYLTGDLMWEFYYGTPKQQENLRVLDLLPINAQVEITLTVSPTTAKAAIGILAVGSFQSIGLPQYGFKAQPVDYSRITTDVYGTVSIIPGLTAKNIQGDCHMKAEDAQAALDVIYEQLGKPSAWLVTDEPKYDYLNTFGLGSADMAAAGPSHAVLSLNVRGLI